MPSWQARIVSLLSRLTVKRAGVKQAYDEYETVRRVRRSLEPAKYIHAHLPRGVSHNTINEENLRGEWLIANESNDSYIYYLHGGGYIAGSPVTHRNFTTNLARSAKAKVFAIDYRLAPEHPFPAALEDAMAGYRWLLEQGVPPEKLVIGGDSAGGGLTMATMLAVRDEGLPLPTGAFLLSPWTDLACTGPSLELNDERDQMLCSKEVHRMSKVYYSEASPLDPLVSPLYANFASLPPLLIYASDSEVLLDDSVRLAERARYYGVEVDLRVWHNQLHAWPVFISFKIPESRKALLEIAEFVRERTSAVRAAQIVAA